jgi:osmoprotectant transport system substrate-binding protein
MKNAKRKQESKQEKTPIKEWILLLSSIMAVAGWALLIWNNIPKPLPAQPPTIQNGIQLSADTVPAGETIEAKVIVKDANLPDDEMHYFWSAHLGSIGEQLNRFEGPQVIYVAPDQPGIDFITITVNDREGGTDRDFRAITITERRKRHVIVGNKDFTEQYIVGEMMRQLLEYQGFAVELESDLMSPDLRRRMEDGDIDICADYTGTIWMVALAQEYKPGMDNNKLYRLVKEKDEENGLIWLKPIWNNNTYALASWPKFVEEHGLKTLSDLAELYGVKDIKTFIDTHFATRPDGLPGLEKHYGFKVAEAFKLIGNPGASLLGLEENKCDVAMVYGTDPAIAEHGWYLYNDDKVFFPPYDLTPYVRKEVLDKYPEIAAILNELVVTFPGGGGPATPEIVAEGQKVWQELNGKVDIDGIEPDEVAREYLIEHGLIKEQGKSP